MDIIQILAALAQHGFTCKNRVSLETGYGEKCVLRCGGILTVYTTGNWQIQGKMTPEERGKLMALMEQLLPKKKGSF
jgi:predicted nucleotide-binding protein